MTGSALLLRGVGLSAVLFWGVLLSGVLAVLSPELPLTGGSVRLGVGGESGEGVTTTGLPSSGPLSAARTHPTDMNPTTAAPSTSSTTIARCFMPSTLSPFEETTLKPR